MKEERGSQRWFLSVWVALSRIEDPGVLPPLSTYRSIPLSFLLIASPGGLRHLIWINEEVDLRLASSRSIPFHSCLAELSKQDYVVFTHILFLLLSPPCLHFILLLFLLLWIFSFLCLFSTHFALYLKPWQCKSLCMCNSILALLTDKAVLFIVGTTCVSCPTALFGWSSLAAHAVLIYGHTLREIHVTAVHEYPHGKSAKAQVQTHTHSQPSCALPNLWWVSPSNWPVNRCWARLMGVDRGDGGIWLQNKGKAKLKASV